MSKINLGVIFGGISTEHEVSMVSGQSIVEHLDETKYNIFPICIDKDGKWYEYKTTKDTSEEADISVRIYKKTEIKNIVNYLKELDIVFPVLHGKYGEDGAIQGMLEMFKIPYVGCKVLASSIGMDKAYSKIMFEKAGIKQAKYCYVRKYKNAYKYIENNFDEENIEIDELCKKVEMNLGLPVFIKPSNYGSSVGISKAKTQEELKKGIEEAAKYDNKILIEENIIGKEVECAVLGNEEVEASCIGQIIPAEEFYTYDAKYKNSESKIIIPVNIECEEAIQKLAIKAFKAIDGKGLARVDFFVTNNNEIYINEINTIPGFTSISMYPKLWEASGIKYGELLDKLIKIK